MPIIHNAKKALKQTKTRTARNRVVKAQVRNLTKTVAPTTLSQLFSTVDKAVKRHLIHKNKAARIKSKAAIKFAQPSTPVKKTSKTTKAK